MLAASAPAAQASRRMGHAPEADPVIVRKDHQGNHVDLRRQGACGSRAGLPIVAGLVEQDLGPCPGADQNAAGVVTIGTGRNGLTLNG